MKHQEIVSHIATHGFAYIPGSHYFDEAQIADLWHFQASYFKLPADEKGGRRYRAYLRLQLENDRLTRSLETSYSQSPEYNEQHGGVKRNFGRIPDDVSESAFFSEIVNRDLELARLIGDVDFDVPVRIGVHAVRYAPTANEVSTSSPPWLHRDDEEIVFVHLVNLSGNIAGGDTVISEGKNSFSRVMRLQGPMDTLCVTKKYFHAVTPLGCLAGQIGFRDILLVTFQPETAMVPAG